MKVINCFYLIFILLLFLIFTYEVEDSCPNGMRKTYVDDESMNQYGSARTYCAALSFFQYPGSLFFKRKVLIEPRFEVHLKVNTQAIEIVEKETENKIYGFTIVISKHNNTISGFNNRLFEEDTNDDNTIFNDKGFNNFTGTIIFEFKFERNISDSSDSITYSVKTCEEGCDISKSSLIRSDVLNSQKYNTTKENNWDISIVCNGSLYLYSGENNILNLDVTFGEYFETNIGYVGFTGFMESNRREISLIGSFICEETYEMSLMPGAFLVNGNSYQEYSFEAGESINYEFKFINNKNEIIEHTYGYDMWNYNFSVSSDCGETTNSMTKVNDYTLKFLTKACTKVGIHTLHLSEKNKGNAPYLNYTVNAGPMKKIELIGHDGIINTVPLKNISNYKYLNYGDSLSGDFIFKNKTQLFLDYSGSDQYGNLLNVSLNSTLFYLKNVNSNGDVSTVNDKEINYIIEEKEDHYQMIITI